MENIENNVGDSDGCPLHFTSSQGYKIYCKHWKPSVDIKPIAMVYINHGFAEHCAWYDGIAEDLTENGVIVFANDHVGHGKSEGPRANISYFQTYVDDLFILCDIMKKKYPDIPLFMFGHSMGGCISLLAGLKRPDYFAGMVLEAPAVVAHPDSAQRWKICAAHVLGWLVPWLPVPVYLDKTYCSKDPVIRKKIEEDPLCYQGGLKGGWGLAMLNALSDLQSRLHEVTWPLLVVHGGDDRLCDINGSKLLIEKAASADKSLSVYDGAYHQLRNEPDGVGKRATVEIVNWFLSRTP